MLVAYAGATAETQLEKLPLSHFPQFDDPDALLTKIKSMLVT